MPEEIVSGSGKLAQNSSQRAGSAMTYAKRYGECLALDIVTGEDFDGSVPRQRPPALTVTPQPTTDTKTPPTAKDLQAQLWAMLAAHDSTLTASNQWTESKEFLLNNSVLKPGESITKLPVERLAEIIAATKKLLNP